MHDYNKAAGAMLRSLRRQRGLTQIQAACLLNTSSPVLSRKERGQEQIERLDIQLAIAGYQLNHEERQALWSAAGYLPEPPVHQQAEHRCCQAKQLLAELPFPAFLVDEVGEVQAWNQPLAALWSEEGPFVTKRHSAQVRAEQRPDREMEPLVRYASPLGPIDYLVLQTPLPFSQAYTLIVYMPARRADYLRFEQYKAQINSDNLLVAEPYFTQKIMG